MKNSIGVTALKTPCGESAARWVRRGRKEHSHLAEVSYRYVEISGTELQLIGGCLECSRTRREKPHAFGFLTGQSIETENSVLFFSSFVPFIAIFPLLWAGGYTVVLRAHGLKKSPRSRRRLTMTRIACGFSLLCAATAIALPAQTFTNLDNFNFANGELPYAAMIQATNGKLYGTTIGGGYSDQGVIFTLTTSGELSRFYSFCEGCSDEGFDLYGGLIQATNGDFYGTTYFGTSGGGTVFKITPAGTLTTLYSFCTQSACSDGEYPIGGLVRTSNGDFYGTTSTGGGSGGGTVFKITPAGALSTLYNFCSLSACADGESPQASLIQAANGDLYGTTTAGGSNNGGTVFKMTLSGTLTTLHSFACASAGCEGGSNPSYASVAEGVNGDFYGTTSAGGTEGDGTVFKMTPTGVLTTLYNFCSLSACADGNGPQGGLTLATDGNFYGTTEFNNIGGGGFFGTIFKITPGGTLTTLHSFAGADGADPIAAPVQDTNGILYGTTAAGGSPVGLGSVWSLSVGLGPFIKTQTASGEIGAAVNILGTDLTGATSVTFNRTSAEFTVGASGTYISTTVPTGATTGTVEVVTPTGTLSSNVPFRIP